MEFENNVTTSIDLDGLGEYKWLEADMTPTRTEIIKALQEDLDAHRREVSRLETALIALTPEIPREPKRDTRPLRTATLRVGQGPTRDWLRQVLARVGEGMTPQGIRQTADSQKLRIPRNFPHKMLHEMKDELVKTDGRYSLKEKASD
ncbi:MAG: hypothetical protein ABR865_06200 [Terracidiphilus sp.]|jgi:hypothetical protein